MKKVIMTLAALSLFASGPAFAGAGCSSQGGAYSGSSAPAPTARAERKAAAAAKAAKLMAAKEAAEDAAVLQGLADAKLPKQAVAAVEALSGTSGLAAEVASECKQYSATIGSLISVACE